MTNHFKEEKHIYNPVAKKADAIPMWFCFPATYMIAMASLGYLHLFRLLDENPDVSPERVYTDTEKTIHPVQNVELMGVSFSFEFDFMGLFSVLDKYKIPRRSADRGEDFPLIFAGGPVSTANPEPFADFFDFFIVGEGEEILEEIVEAYKETRNASKQEKLVRLAQIEGLYVPALYKPEYKVNGEIEGYTKLSEFAPDEVKRRHIKKLTESVYTPILTKKSVFPNMFLIETARGCPKRCKFCIASYLTLPARYPDFESIKRTIDLGLEYSNKLGFLGALITEHPDFEKICEYVLEKRKHKEFEISVSSLRVDKITPLIIQTLVECGQKQNTIAVEAGTERLRKYINKSLIEEDIFRGVKIAHENGLKGLKVYGMIGLPSETDEDIKALADLMIRLKQENKGFNLTLSTSSFVPKAHAPFQWAERPNSSDLEKKNNYLRKELNKHKVIYKPTSIKWDYIQAILSRGDRRLSPLLEKVHDFGGTIGSWNRAYRELKSSNIPDFDWYALRKRSYDEIQPWNIINSGVKTEHLKSEAEKQF